MQTSVSSLETLDERFRRNLRTARTARRMTVRQLSARMSELGHPLLPSGVSKIETGGRQSVTLAEVAAICRALNVPEQQMLFRNVEIEVVLRSRPRIRQ